VQGAKQKNRISFFSGLLLLFNFFAALMLLLVYVSVYINPDKVSFIAFAGMGYPLILFINILFVLLWVFVRIKHTLLSLAFIVLGWNHIGRLVQINQKKDFDKATKSVKVFSYNIQNFVGQNVANTKYITNFENQAKIMNLIKDQDAEIICLQEMLYDRGDVQKFVADFGQKIKAPNFYYRNYYNTTNQKLDAIAIFTRFPVIKKGYLEQDEKTIGIYNDLIIAKDTIRLYNLHLASIHFKKEEYDFIGDLPNQQDQEVIKKHSIQVISKLQAAFVKRGRQAAIVKEHLKNSPYPVIICGDFNDTPTSYAYRKIASGLTDAFVESGEGFGVTYAGESFPSFRIDYILHDDVFISRGFIRHKNSFSDHYPISCYLIRRENSK
jgi:endonuclease/exonuclease/phosphatase family metal-dependent hydrolase